jgi:hypothetical protein
MKKLLIISFLCFCTVCTRAQSISLYDLTNLVNVDINGADNVLTSGKPFKLQYLQDVNGFTLRHYQGTTPDSKAETIIVGDGVKTQSAAVLQSVTYTSTNIKYVLLLLKQAKTSGLNKIFEGVDAYNNIYIFDNYLYNIHIFLKNDNSEGTIKVLQKDFVQ